MKIKIILTLLSSVLILAYALKEGKKTTNKNFHYKSFDEYINKTKEHISKNRKFITLNKIKELNANTPFEMGDKNSSKGILFVHGLGDSPYYFFDMAKAMSKKGFYVRSILLPDHGTKPEDLISTKEDAWEKEVKKQIKLMKKEVKDLYLAGFSTGANLVSSYALDDSSIKGLFLFSPAYKSNYNILGLSPYVRHVKTWADEDPNDNPIHYQSLAMNAAYLYYKTTLDIQEKLEKQNYTKPVLFVISQDDDVINKEYLYSVYEKNFLNKNNKLIFYGKEKTNLKNEVFYNSYIKEKRISNFSHTSLLFSKDNYYYGEEGEYLMLDNGQKEVDKKPKRNEVWYSSYGYIEEGKYHARLIWNPYFEELITHMYELTLIK